MRLLCLADGVNGVIGAEYHAHVGAVMAFAHFLRQPGSIGGGGVAQLVGEGLHHVVVLLALFAHVAVRAHGKAVQGCSAFLRPLSQGLR